MKKYIVLSLMLFICLPLITLAQVRGIVVSPSDIIADSVTDWPYTTSILVTNQGEKDEWIEVAIFGDNTFIMVEPSRFVLLEGKQKRIVITIDKKDKQKVIASLKISATRNNTDGASIGTGIEIPVAVSSTALTVGDMQRASVASTLSEKTNFLSTFGLFLILIVSVLIIGRVSVRMSQNWNNE